MTRRHCNLRQFYIYFNCSAAAAAAAVVVVIFSSLFMVDIYMICSYKRLVTMPQTTVVKVGPLSDSNIHQVIANTVRLVSAVQDRKKRRGGYEVALLKYFCSWMCPSFQTN